MTMHQQDEDEDEVRDGVVVDGNSKSEEKGLESWGKRSPHVGPIRVVHGAD